LSSVDSRIDLQFQKTYGGFWRIDANKLNQPQAD
jgi:hypothetical protein